MYPRFRAAGGSGVYARRVARLIPSGSRKRSLVRAVGIPRAVASRVFVRASRRRMAASAPVAIPVVGESKRSGGLAISPPIIPSGGGRKWYGGILPGLGTAAGTYFGGPVGGVLGGLAGSLFSKVTGFGDYKVASNTILTGTDPPVFASSGRGTIIRHREFLQDITTASTANTFNIQGFNINAALPGTFPWLSQIAQNFEQYCMRGMIFEFKTMSADALNSTNTALGSVIMATQYNSLAAPFASKAAMENHEFCTSAKPSVSFMHPIECARGETPVSCLYTRTTAVPSGADQRLYDLGTFYIATTGFQGTNVNIGELWVTYDVELLKPQLTTAGVVGGGLGDHYRITAPTATNWFGTAQFLQGGSNLGTTISAGTNEILFPQQQIPVQYFIYYQVTGATTTLTNSFGVTWHNGTPLTMFQDGSASQVAAPPGVSNAVADGAFTGLVAAGQSNASFQISSGTLPTSVTHCDLFILQLPSFLTLPKPVSDSKAEVKTPVLPVLEDDEEDDEELRAYFARRRRARAMAEVLAEANGSVPTTTTAAVPTTTTTPSTSTTIPTTVTPMISIVRSLSPPPVRVKR